MAVLPIVLYPDPILLRPTRPVEDFDDGIRQLVGDLVDTMYAAPGIGLAANQLCVGRRICVVDLTAGEQPDGLKVFVNPSIVAEEGSQLGDEGCLSFPDVTLEIRRSLQITVEALDEQGQPFSLTADDLLARAILHECEHLDGQTFLRNVSSLKRDLVKNQIRKRIRAGDWVSPAEP